MAQNLNDSVELVILNLGKLILWKTNVACSQKHVLIILGNNIFFYVGLLVDMACSLSLLTVDHCPMVSQQVALFQWLDDGLCWQIFIGLDVDQPQVATWPN